MKPEAWASVTGAAGPQETRRLGVTEWLHCVSFEAHGVSEGGASSRGPPSLHHGAQMSPPVPSCSAPGGGQVHTRTLSPEPRL